MESVSTAASTMGRLDEVRGAVNRSGNTRLDKVIDVLDIIYNYFIVISERDRYANFYESHTSSNPKTVRLSKTDYFQHKLDRDTQAVYGYIKKGGYTIGKDDEED